jgi:hypothetical protein
MDEESWSPHSCPICKRIVIDRSNVQFSRGTNGVLLGGLSIASAAFSILECLQAEIAGCPLFQRLASQMDQHLTPEIDVTSRFYLDVMVQNRPSSPYQIQSAWTTWRWQDDDIAPREGYFLHDYSLFRRSELTVQPADPSRLFDIESI